jgi:chorismate mutase
MMLPYEPVSPSLRLRGIRGATTVELNQVEAYQERLCPLLDQLIELNHIAPDQVVTMFFTVTPDLTCVSPAKLARLHLGWHRVPMMCAQEPVIDGLPQRCVRVLIQCYSELSAEEIRPVYLHGATVLRPDLLPESPDPF